MDKVGGWNEEGWVGSKFPACMWLYTEAVLCDGRGRPPQDLRQMLQIIKECVLWVSEDFLWEHESVTEANFLWKENDILEALNYYIDAPCPLQGVFCGSPHRRVQNIEKLSTWRLRSHITCPRTCLLRAVSVLLCNSPDKDWNHEEDLKECGF